MTSDPILVYGAYGHTGRFVVAELQRRGWTPIAAGRDRNALAELDRLGLATRPITVDEPDKLARAAGDARAILNCAGPFAATAAPLIGAALRAGIPYLDITGEPDVVADTFERFGSVAAARGVVVMPAASFFGALGDLLASAALGGWSRADSIAIAYALDEWKPTSGTRRAMQAMNGKRLVFRHGHLTIHSTAPPIVERVFPPPFGPRSMIGEYPSPESVLIPQHIATPDVDVFMTVDAIRDLREPDGRGPASVDDHGRSGQTFAVQAQATRDGETRSALATGCDIYATTAPVLVECMERVLDTEAGYGGVHAAGGLFDARDFLDHLAHDEMTITVGAT
jgi:short subunit dehydrogenase-like uncharacterized protein